MLPSPVVDISAWVNIAGELPTKLSDLTPDQLRAASIWDNCLSSDGYAVIVGHGIQEEHFNTLNEEAKRFFMLPIEEKLLYSRGVYGHTSGGYTARGTETVALSLTENDKIEDRPKPDPVENFVFTSDPDLFAAPNSTNTDIIGSPIASSALYFHSMERLLRCLHRLSAAALSLPDLSYFEPYYDEQHPQNRLTNNHYDDNLVQNENNKNGNALRLAYYPADTNTTSFEHRLPSFSVSQLRYGAHTDYQGFTILRPDPRDWHTLITNTDTAEETWILPSEDEAADIPRFGGLEVWSSTLQQWRRVCLSRFQNALVVNVGDLLQYWTNDHWHSPLHRVSPPPLGHSVFARQAIVFFSGPVADSVIVPILRDGDVPHYEPVRSGDYLQRKLQRSNG